jgi:hypothetical protein
MLDTFNIFLSLFIDFDSPDRVRKTTAKKDIRASDIGTVVIGDGSLCTIFTGDCPVVLVSESTK